ncbi:MULTISPECIES: helix-turn-helix domain-containing protein [unclassified Sphingomonas]|uniref:helix-turn-helix domain-containing protein n=1 Tax=unclassified Sphingomonas TaxID=196159 RepID=UPI00138F5CDD|nr:MULTISPECIES: helix-turn-helix domain-containing protein [unclassified Sphingomonas]
MATPLDRLARTTGIPQRRLSTLCHPDRVSLAEIDALARAWSISAGDLRASIPSELIVP